MARTKKITSEKIENENISDVGSKDFIENAYEVYGRDIMESSYQKGRQFCDVNDGLKIAYRHHLQTLLDCPNHLVKVSWVLGESMKRYHFHGDLNAEKVIYSLVNDYNILLCQGNSGSRTMTEDKKGAAPRYPEVMMRPEIKEQLNKLMYLVPEEETVTKAKEKRYIPTPIPLSLVAGADAGLGIGFRNYLPCFTADSLLKAYLKNDSSLLRLNYGYTLGKIYDEDSWFDTLSNKVIKGKNILEFQEEKNGISEENKEQLENLWTTGKGKLTIGIPVYNCEINGMKGFIAVCDPAITKPSVSKKILEWEENGWVEYFDYSDEIGKMFFGITKGTRKVTLDELKEEVLKKCKMLQTGGLKASYEINIALDDTTGPIGIYQWIDYTYNNYSNLYRKYLKDELNNLEFMERVWRNFKFVSDRLVNNSTKELSDKKIMEECNSDKNQKKLQEGKDVNGKKFVYDCTLDVIKFISEKPIGTLRKEHDIKEKLEKIFEQREKYVKFDIPKEIKNFCNLLTKHVEVE